MKSFSSFIRENIEQVSGWGNTNTSTNQQNDGPIAQGWKNSGWTNKPPQPMQLFNSIKDFCTNKKIIVTKQMEENALRNLFTQQKGNLNGNNGVITMSPNVSQSIILNLIVRDPQIANEFKTLLDKSYFSYAQVKTLGGVNYNEVTSKKQLEEWEQKHPNAASKLGFMYTIVITDKENNQQQPNQQQQQQPNQQQQQQPNQQQQQPNQQQQAAPPAPR